jgi:hypothetical protein
MDERQKVALDLTEDLEVEFKRFGEVFDKKQVFFYFLILLIGTFFVLVETRAQSYKT